MRRAIKPPTRRSGPCAGRGRPPDRGSRRRAAAAPPSGARLRAIRPRSPRARRDGAVCAPTFPPPGRSHRSGRVRFQRPRDTAPPPSAVRARTMRRPLPTGDRIVRTGVAAFRGRRGKAWRPRAPCRVRARRHRIARVGRRSHRTATGRRKPRATPRCHRRRCVPDRPSPVGIPRRAEPERAPSADADCARSG